MDEKKINILFYCRSSKTKLMVHLAKEIQDQGYIVEPYAFVAYYKKWYDYLIKQNIISFKKIYTSDEIFKKIAITKIDYSELERFERTYGTQEIWNIIYSERFITPHLEQNIYNHPKWREEDIYIYIQLCFQMAERIIRETNIDCIIDFAAVNTFRGILDLVAKYNNIPYLWVAGSVVLEDRIHINRRGWDNYKFIERRYHELLNNNGYDYTEGFKYLKKFRDNPSEGSYSNYLSLNKKKKEFSVKTIISYIYSNAKKILTIIYEVKLRKKAKKNPAIRYNFQLYKNLSSIKFIRYLQGKIRRIYINIKKPYKKEPLPENFLFLTLHLQPEASTSVKAPFYVNELNFIEGVSRALPLHWKLVVKPHPRMVEKKPIRFYKIINKIPNVQLVSPDANTNNLIKKSKAVIAITGTSGFEALLSGKKVIVAGNTPWSIVNGVSICRDLTQLHDVLKEAESYVLDEESLIAYLQAVHDCTFSFDQSLIWNSDYDLNNKNYKNGITKLANEMIVAYQDFKKYNLINKMS